MSFTRLSIVVTMFLAVLGPTAVHADGFVTPFAGVNFGGRSGDGLADAFDAGRFDWGVSFAFMSGGILGMEADIAHSPDFYGRTDVGSSSVLTATGNLLIGIPIGGQQGVGVRPYVLAGIGVIRSEVHDFGDGISDSENDVAWNVGGGAMFFFGNHVGLRADLRYFRTFNAVVFDFIDDLIDRDRADRVDFGRASLGLVLRF
jgi:opacity protein-like surface antigen